MEIVRALGELGHFGDPAGQGEAGRGMAADIFERRCGEVAHLDQGELRKVMAQARRLRRAPPGGGGEMRKPRGAGDIDAAGDGGDPGRRHRAEFGGGGEMRKPRGAGDIDAAGDGGDPGRRRVGNHDSGGAEDGKPAHDAKPRIERLGGEALTLGDRDGEDEIGSHEAGAGEFLDHPRHHSPRHRIDGRLARGKRQAGERHRPHAGPGAEHRTCPGRGGAHRDADRSPMGDVGIVARIFDDGGLRPLALPPKPGERKPHPLAARQRDLHLCPLRQTEERAERRLGRRRGAGAGGIAVAEGLGGLAWHTLPYSGRRGDVPQTHEKREGVRK